MKANHPLRIPADEMFQRFFDVLRNAGFGDEGASGCAKIFTDNSLDGVYTHGVNRFSRFVQTVKNGVVKAGAEAVAEQRCNAVEQWDGQSGPGMLNAVICTRRSMELADQFGMGCVALRHTNHWMRGGTYGWQAAEAGYGFIGWSNTFANMPAWGGSDPKLGNNPIVAAVPFEKDAIVLDMAMSQFSIGALHLHHTQGLMLPVPGGYDRQGELSTDPGAILESKRVLPTGYWKGAGLSLLLDLLASVLSNGLSVADITRQREEHNLSQVFITFNLRKFHHASGIAGQVRGIIDDYHNSLPLNERKDVLFPGERVIRTRKENQLHGIPVTPSVWEEIRRL